MRFAKIRQTVTKGVDTPSLIEIDGEPVDNPATPRHLSPYEPGGFKVRHGVDPLDVPSPAHNRKSRRGVGMLRGRLRLGGVALRQKPWHQVAP
jgi:hypothetical protein